MYYVYILFSEQYGKLYIGSTPVKLIYYESYLSGTDAKRNVYYKKRAADFERIEFFAPA